ncbi:MAG TPA: hypothetical protein VMH78_06745 [Thermoplasmata archaeon]|nr:hypothetical protein [Thermoplasmata archaeon]
MSAAALSSTPSAASPRIAPVPREAAERVLDYLIFHRSLLDEPGGPPALLERYLGLVREIKEGVHLAIADPVEKATALLFELVMGEEFDPWEIDLVRFTEVYLGRVEKDGAVDFAVAGRLLYMAWSILYLQSEAVLKQREETAAPVAPEGAQWDPSADGPLEDGAEPIDGVADAAPADLTSAVLGGAETPLVEMVRHTETRPVSLLELVQAFGEAEAEARRALRLEELRGRLQEEQRAVPEVLVHGDVPERDILDAWRAIADRPVGVAFPFLELWRPEEGRERLVALFLAALFLARERSIDLSQESLGSSPLLLARAAEVRTPPPEN